MLTANALYAKIQGARCEGDQECYWCASPCDRKWIHDDPHPSAMFIRRPGLAKRPGNPWICYSCWLYRRKRVTVKTLTGKLLDRQCLLDHSWLMLEDDIFVLVSPEDYSAVYDYLLRPPLIFCLSLLEAESGLKNHIQLCVCNDNSEVIAERTNLQFTYNNRIVDYNVYELQEGLRFGDPDGKMPGVRTLTHMLGKYEFKREGDGVKRERGRPKKQEDGEERAVIKRVHRDEKEVG